MRRLMLILTLLTGVATSQSDATKQASDPDYRASFRGRTLDLEPFLTGFPYSSFTFDREHGHLLYLEKTGAGTWLRHLELPEAGPVDLSKGRKIGTEDWSQRTWWGCRFHEPSGKLFLTSDQGNDEVMNLYSIDLESGAIEQLTDSDYTYGWSFSEDDRLLGYLSRAGRTEPFDTTLVVRDLETRTEKRILSDGGGKDRFIWSSIKFTPDGSKAILRVQHDGQRNTTSLAMIDLHAEEPEFQFLIPPRVKRFELSLIEGWVSNNVFLYLSAEEGYSNLYRHDVATGQSKRLTSFEDDLRGVHLLASDPPTAIGVLRRPHESELVLLDAQTGRVLDRRSFDASVSVEDAIPGEAILEYSSLESPFRAERLVLTEEGFGATSLLAEVPPDLGERISQLRAERVEFETFDDRQLHAYYLEPKNPPADPADQLVMIVSFYGGGNRFSTRHQILAAAGIAILSPSPRGSRGFGAEFAALNDGDLGGDEIVDILHAAEWLVTERGYEPHQVGVFGGSHGGYATMRCLTFPPETNGRDAAFPFGFGWSHAGFSDILSFYETCNIPDWVVKEAGDPKTEAAKLRDRSPLTHVERLAAPLLLTHGENDWRVPVTESRKFATRARELGKPVTYVEFPGQGHSIRGVENRVRYWQEAFDFLETVGEKPKK